MFCQQCSETGTQTETETMSTKFAVLIINATCKS